ncbi:MAG: hypothetical protein Q4A88_07435, partial [Clostridia bacterium]|nr:hypothetical protein [Clostridia bacterium]
MGKYVLKRIGLAFLTTFIILSLTFILVKLLPFERPIGGDQQQIAYFDRQYHLGYVYRLEKPTDQYGSLLYKSPSDRGRAFYYYQVPVLEQYVNWIKIVIT